MPLFNIPDEVITLIIPYLGVLDIGRFDTAICSKEYRAALKNCYVKVHPRDWKGSFRTQSLIWLQDRSIRPANLSISLIPLKHYEQILSKVSYTILENVECLEVVGGNHQCWISQTCLLSCIQGGYRFLRDLRVDTCADLTDAILIEIGNKCSCLESLRIENKAKRLPLANDGLLYVAQHCQYLKEVSMRDYTEIRDTLPAELACACSAKLKTLSFVECDFMETGDRIRGYTSTIESVSFCSCFGMQSQLIYPLTDLLKSCAETLKFLNISYVDINMDAIVDWNCHNLVELQIDNLEDLSVLGLHHIISRSPRIESLTVYDAPIIDDEMMACIAELLPNLKRICLDGGYDRVSDAAISTLLDLCPKLKSLEIDCSCLVDDCTIDLLISCQQKLEKVRFVGCESITSESVARLRHARPDCDVQFSW